MAKSDEFEKKIRCKKARLRLFIMENQPCTFAKILQNAKLTKNKHYLKKYLDDLIRAKSVIYISTLDKYITLPVSKYNRNEVSFVLLGEYIYLTIRDNPTIHKNDFLKAVYYTNKIESFDFDWFDNRSLPERVFAKFYVLWKLKLSIFELDLQKTKNADDSTWQRVQNSHDVIIGFGQKLQSFLEKYSPKLPVTYLRKLENELDMEWEMDVIYNNKLLFHTRPLYEILRVAITELLVGPKLASKIHLDLRRISKLKHGVLPEVSFKKTLDEKRKYLRTTPDKGIKKRIENFEKKYAKLILLKPRKYPKKLTNTKNLLRNLTDDEGRPDEAKIISYYLSELGRINILPTPYEFVKLYLNSWALRNFVNTAPDTPKNIKLKKRIQRNFDSLQVEV